MSDIDVGKVGYRFEIEDIVRGPPPVVCHYPVTKRILMAVRTLRYGCPLMWTRECARCPKRPVKSHNVEGISIHDAIARGLVSKEQAQRMMKEARTKNGDNQE